MLPALWTAAAILALVWLWRIPSVPFDSDEAQHLHIAHGLAHGELPYRDRFDNHTPLLHFALAPWMGWAGERADVVRRARWALALIPLAALGLLLCAARQALGAEPALWGAILTLAFPDWALTAAQVRPDPLFTAIAFLAVWLLIRNTFFPRALDWMVFGFLMGVGFLTSLKAVFFFAAAGLAAAMVAWLGRRAAPGGMAASG
ncbi:MAG: glycosyltransferase family 39 protein, partial [Terrimicrobiaceae bacterium]|nr:glycosyltransferase family 39 protein [Terrimicrobiaceae bacterium]